MNPAAETFDEIYARHADMVFNLCLSYLHNQEDAEEVTQDVFVKVHRQLPGFQGKSSLKTWIYRIAINQCLDFLRTRKRLKRFGIHLPIFGTESDVPLPHFDHPGVQLEQKEAVERLFQQIHHLPEKQKTALILRAIEGQSMKEIAAVMEISPKAVESLLSRARATLKKNIRPYEGL